MKFSFLGWPLNPMKIRGLKVRLAAIERSELFDQRALLDKRCSNLYGKDCENGTGACSENC